jgi:hypothetical protein
MHDWPDRAQWTQEQRTPYAHSTPDFHRRVSELASPEEIAEIVAELQHHYQDLGRQLRVAKRSAPLLDQQKGETRAAWYGRWKALPRERQELYSVIHEARDKRHRINRIVKAIREDNSGNLALDTGLGAFESRPKALISLASPRGFEPCYRRESLTTRFPRRYRPISRIPATLLADSGPRGARSRGPGSSIRLTRPAPRQRAQYLSSLP